MAKSTSKPVTMRVRIGDTEIEVTGPSPFVEKKINEFLKRATGSSGLPGGPPSRPAPALSVAPKKLSPAQFFKKSAVRTAVDKVLAAGYFLEKYRNQENFTALDVRTLLRQAKHRPPTNTNDALNGNIRKGFVMSK